MMKVKKIKQQEQVGWSNRTGGVWIIAALVFMAMIVGRGGISAAMQDVYVDSPEILKFEVPAEPQHKDCVTRCCRPRFNLKVLFTQGMVSVLQRSMDIFMHLLFVSDSKEKSTKARNRVTSLAGL